MKNPLVSRHFAHHRPRDKLVTYYLYCYDKEAREQERTTPKKNERQSAKRKRELER